MIVPIVKYDNKIRWTFAKWSKWDRKEMWYSNGFKIEGATWKIGLRMASNNIHFYLKCSVDENDKAWIAAVNAKFTLLRQTNPSNHWSTGFGKTEFFTHFNNEKYGTNAKEYNDRYIHLYECVQNGGYLENDAIIVDVDFDFIYQNFSKDVPNYTDIILEVGGVNVHLNKAVLCTCAEYFSDSMITGKFEDSKMLAEKVNVVDFLTVLLLMHPNTPLITANIFSYITGGEYENHVKLTEKFGVRSYQTKISVAISSMFLSQPTDKSNSTLVNVLTKCIKFGDKYNYPTVVTSCLSMFKNAADVKKASTSLEFDELSSETKAKILMLLLKFL